MPVKKPTIKNKPKDLALDHYHCTLFLPLTGLENSGFKPVIDRHYHNTATNNDEGASYYYFSPTLREILYDNGQTEGAIKEWRLSEETLENWTLTLDNSKAPDWSAVKTNQEASITSVRLLQYFNGIYLLAIRLEPSALIELKKKNEPLEKQIEEIEAYNKTANKSEHQEVPKTVFEKIKKNSLEEFNRLDSENIDLYQQLIMENWLHFTRLIRLIYPSFEQQSDENKIAPIHFNKGNKTITAFDKKVEKSDLKDFEDLGKQFSPVLCEILKAFVSKKESEKLAQQIEESVQFYDDRVFVSVAYSIAGEKLPEVDLQRINSFVSYVDRQEADGWEKDLNGYAYTQKVIEAKIKKQAFTLWEGLGGYYTFTDFSNSYLNTGKGFRTFIANEHIPHIYDRMLIQALFYQASLRHYDNIICESTKELTDPNKNLDIEKIKQQRAEFIKFTNQYWFHKLTEQMQGKEIFALQQKGLGVQEHYEILKDEIERTDEYLQTVHEIKENKTNSNIAFYGLGFALLALWYTILPILNTAFSSKTQTLWQVIGCRAGFTSPESTKIAGLAIAIILPAIVIPLLYKFYKSIKKR